ASAEMVVHVVPPLVIRYAWTQTTLEWSENGATEWADGAPSGCFVFTDTGATTCVTNYQAAPDPAFPFPRLERQGTLESSPSGLALTEQLNQDWQHYVMRYTAQAPGFSDSNFQYAIEARTADSGVRNYPVGADVSVSHLQDRVEVRGLRA